ncbi:hypothetical protein ACLKA7_012189 [Drosophila subpalustris]
MSARRGDPRGLSSFEPAHSSSFAMTVYPLPSSRYGSDSASISISISWLPSVVEMGVAQCGWLLVSKLSPLRPFSTLWSLSGLALRRQSVTQKGADVAPNRETTTAC